MNTHKMNISKDYSTEPHWERFRKVDKPRVEGEERRAKPRGRKRKEC